MKQTFILLLGILVFSGCGVTQTTQVTSKDSLVQETWDDTQTYRTDKLSVSFPSNYVATTDGDMLVVMSQSGKIIIGGFTPSVGHPDPEEKDFPFRKITYSKDPKEIRGSIPAALYHTYGDAETENELMQIFDSVTAIKK